ncbi:MAG: PAS domain S-box protein [Chloroflexi bacterium]|nr:PAS domain S-box protein [Chloroflexota bacterium]
MGHSMMSSPTKPRRQRSPAWARARAWALLLMLGGAAPSAPAPPATEESPWLTSAKELRSLSVQEARRSPPIRLLGGVTFNEPARKLLFIQDSTVLRSPTAVRAPERPPWWTVQRTLAALGFALVISAAALGWVAILLKRVREQTARIRRQWEQEAALEKRYRNLFENANDIVYTHDLAGHLISVNPSAERVFGYSRQEATQMNIAQLMAPDQLKLAQSMTARNVAGQRVTPYELELQAKDGRRVILEINSRAVYQDGKPAAIQGIARDITERKRREIQSAAFSSLGQRLSLATKPEEAAKIVVDIADQLLGWDACCLHFLTSEPRRIVPILYFDVVDGRRTAIPGAEVSKEPSPMDEKVVADGAQLILRDDPARADPALVRFGDKNRACASLMFVPIRHGTQVVGVLSIQSYTHKAYGQEDLGILQSLADLCAGALQRIQAGAALRQSEERFAKAFRASPVPVSISTLAEGRMLDVNEAFLSLFHYQRAEVIGHTAPELGLWVDAGDRHKLVQDLREQRSVRNQLYQFRAKTGEVRQGLVSVEVIDLGQEPCLIFITHDITERLNLEAQFRHAQKMEAVGQLAAGVAHDFNNIMTIIQGHAGLLLGSGAMDVPTVESLKEISQAADRAAKLTRQLLTFSRRQVMQRQALDLNEVISNMTNMLRRLLGEDIGLHFNFSTSVPPVLAGVGMVP